MYLIDREKIKKINQNEILLFDHINYDRIVNE